MAIDGDDDPDSGQSTLSPGTVVRLFVEADLGTGAEVALDAPRAHYLRNVLRRQPGDRAALFNGRDGEWHARIDTLRRGAARLKVEEKTRPQRDEADLWLVFAPVKRARIDMIAEKATELGVAALWPVFTQHTAVTRVNHERLRANAIEAAEQTERLSVSAVFETAPLVEVLADWRSDRHLIVCAEAGSARPIAEAFLDFARASDAARQKWAILTGPEGGFARAELDALAKLPFVTPVGLGPRILRADTAALAALACWQAIIGDGRDRPPQRAPG
jgi:16S rRNA (uracil1498-N3)-methyltransferase